MASVILETSVGHHDYHDDVVVDDTSSVVKGG